jgi:hypothetical protein
VVHGDAGSEDSDPTLWFDLLIETAGKPLFGVELWAEIRRMKHVDILRDDIHRPRVSIATRSARRRPRAVSPSYGAAPAAASKLDPFLVTIKESGRRADSLWAGCVSEWSSKNSARGPATMGGRPSVNSPLAIVL